ncbi:MAG: TRAP transporter substrate-binding protein [Alphaproteobacteria bacterium]|nr:TRAP transporter substrate-binding protein [Alphaproteobacteria bacterium]
MEEVMRLGKLIAGIALAASFALPASAAEITMKFGHVGAPGSLFDATANEFARRVNEQMAGKVKIDVFGSSQLGKDKELLQKLKLGTVDFSLPSSVMTSVVDEFGLFDMPYLVKDRAHMGRIEKEIFWNKLAPLVEAKGYKIIALWENGFRHITNNVRPINVPGDLDGIKLRTPKGKWRVKMFQAYGANPTPLAFSEVFVALQTGVMDGQENPFANIYSAKFNEVQKYLSLTGHVYTPGYALVGKKKWESLPADIRDELEKIAQGTQGFVYEHAAQLETDLLAKLKAGGMAVNEADKAAFVKASASIYEQFGSDVEGGKALVDQALGLAN